MVDRQTIVRAAAVVLLMSINVLYGVIEFTAVPQSIETQAFLAASVAWIIGYVYSKGDTWSEGGIVSKVLMASSWFLLVGMEFTAFVPEHIGAWSPWAGGVAVVVHMASFYMTGFKD